MTQTSVPTNRVQIWDSQFASRQLPRVCAVTGDPAEVWRRIRVSTVPASGLIGLLFAPLGFIFFTVRRYRGYLPLTRRANRRLDLLDWSPLIGLAIAAVAGLGIFVAQNMGSLGHVIGPFLGIIGILAFLGGAGIRIFIAPFIGPKARILGSTGATQHRLVEIRNVNPAFVQAVNDQHAQAWASQAGDAPPATDGTAVG